MTSVDICNVALSYLGDTATVSSIDPPEGSAQAQHCARFYPIALNLMLDMHNWNFITTRAYLAVVSTCYFERWEYVYAMPSAVANIISVLPKCMYPTDWFIEGFWEDRLPLKFELDAFRDFQLEVVNGQTAILSNAEDAIVRYTTTTVQPGAFPALFTDALAWKLASMLAGPLLKGDAGAAESKRCLAMSQAIAAQAMGQDANQRHGNQKPIPSAIRARN